MSNLEISFVTEVDKKPDWSARFRVRDDGQVQVMLENPNSVGPAWTRLTIPRNDWYDIVAFINSKLTAQPEKK